jgi:hypothetical protein
MSNDTINSLSIMKNNANVTIELSSKIANLTNLQLQMGIDGKTPPDKDFLKVVDRSLSIQFKHLNIINFIRTMAMRRQIF